MKINWLIQFSDLFGDLNNPLRVLIVTLAGLSFSLMMFSGRYDLPVIAAFIAIAFGYLMELIGKNFLPKYPRLGLAILEWWVIAPAAIAALASAALTVLAVELAPAADATAQDEELLKTFATAVSTFVTAIFVAGASDKDNTRLASRIKATFFARYQRLKPDTVRRDGVMYFNRGSKGENAVYNLNDGWDWSGRRSRIAKLEQAIRKGEAVS